MLGTEIAHFLRRDRRTEPLFLGVFPEDLLPKERIAWPCCLVINTASASQIGEHWVSLFVNGFGVGTYFDSYGLRPTVASVTEFLDRNASEWIFNRWPIQNVVSDKCGYYCLYFLYKACRGQSLSRSLRPFHPSKPLRNDIRVTRWYRRQLRSRHG